MRVAKEIEPEPRCDCQVRCNLPFVLDESSASCAGHSKAKERKLTGEGIVVDVRFVTGFISTQGVQVVEQESRLIVLWAEERQLITVEAFYAKTNIMATANEIECVSPMIVVLNEVLVGGPDT